MVKGGELPQRVDTSQARGAENTMTWHQTIIVGNLGNDPELRYLDNGRAVCSFNVAVNERWKDRNTNEQREKTTWYRVSAWGPLGETAGKFLSKGRQVMVIGTVEARAYTNNAGEAAASLDLTARDVRFLSDGGGGASGSQGGYEEDFSAPSGDVNDIPF
jgi:single-strand DNA-binding protein